ncbi:hypothetical protein FQZ97_1246050 [compost metagenome]
MQLKHAFGRGLQGGVCGLEQVVRVERVVVANAHENEFRQSTQADIAQHDRRSGVRITRHARVVHLGGIPIARQRQG